jgi:hypothetical protein
MNVLIMELHKASIVPALVQLAMRQNLCTPHLPILKCYNLPGPFWYETLSKGHYQMSARSQDNCDSGGMPSMAIEAQVARPHEYRQTPISRGTPELLLETSPEF